MRNLCAILLALCAALAAPTPTRAADDSLLLQKGDRVVFYGDSITQQRLYTRYVQQYVYVRYPELDVRFLNAGWGGDTAKGANARLQRDVLYLDPTVVTLCFGMNDGRYRAADEAIVRSYENEMEKLTEALTSRGIRVLVVSPGCVDADRRPSLASVDYNAALAGLTAAAARVAKRHHCRFVDLHAAMLRVQTELKHGDATFTMIPDSVHPSPAGHLVMTRAILDGLGAERMPALPPIATAPGAQGCTSSMATRLPMWIDAASLDVARACGLLADFAAQRLTVEGLAPGRYTVTIDGWDAGIHEGRELATGVLVPGTWCAAAKQLHDDVAVKENRYFAAWREFRVPRSDRTNARAEIAAVAEQDLRADALLHDLLREEALAPISVRVTVDALPHGPNLAFGKSYECSDPNGFGWGAGGLTDGSWGETAADCFATGSAAAFPKHVTVDLGRAQRLGAVRLGVPAFGSTHTVRVQVSRKGKTFTDVATTDFDQKQSERRTLHLNDAVARYIRLVYVDHHGAQVGFSPEFCFTTELEVYGAKK